MAKRKEHNYEVNFIFTEGWEKRLVDTLVDFCYEHPVEIDQLMKAKAEREKAAGG